MSLHMSGVTVVIMMSVGTRAVSLLSSSQSQPQLFVSLLDILHTPEATIKQLNLQHYTPLLQGVSKKLTFRKNSCN